MHRLILALSALGMIMLTSAGPALALAGGEAAELVAARMNALAGDPVSARDAELLERYGCLSGSRAAICQPRTHRWYKRRGRRRR
jgi:hypothetical protein